MNRLTKKVAHQPFSCELEGATIAIIFIHGILEGPFQFHGLAEIALDHGISSFGILLPGHGGTAEQFANSSRKQWVDYVDQTIEQVAKKYTYVILIGHSMGTLLSLLACEKYDCVIGVMSLATPLSVKVNLKGLLCSLKVMTGCFKPDDEYVLSSYRVWSITKGSCSAYVKWIPRYIDLFKLIYATRKELPTIHKPLLFIQSRCDEFVRNKSTKILKKKLTGSNFEIIELCKSGHFYYRNGEDQKLEEAFEAFLDKLYELNPK